MWCSLSSLLVASKEKLLKFMLFSYFMIVFTEKFCTEFLSIAFYAFMLYVRML